jgi:murein DD-endopeptidase MepM/ murein hydrolase activator NlpD
MKRETLVIVIALTTLLGITAICAHHTAMCKLEAKFRQEIENRDAQIEDIANDCSLLRQELAAKTYHNPLGTMNISSYMGYRTNPMGGTDERLHKGVDLVAEIGTPVEAIADGICVEHWPAPDGVWGGHPIMGGYIVLWHPRLDEYSLYGHLSATFVHEGDRIASGQIIGLVGTTGVSTGPHLHFEIVVNPLEWME